MFPKVNGDVYKYALRLEPLILIRKCCSDPEQHILAKQYLVGLSDDPFAISVIVAMAAAAHFRRVRSVFSVLASLLTVLKFFSSFSNFFTSKTRLSDTPKQSCNVSDC